MKILKLIGFMLLVANFVMAQTTYGVGAGAVGNSSNSNSYYGKDAGTNAVGDNNTYVGSNAGRDSNTGINNVGIGHRSLFQSTGTYNVGIGSKTAETVSGTQNVYIGGLSGLTATNGDNNVGIGYAALQTNNGSSNLAIGLFSGYSNDVGQDNTFMGAYSGRYNLSGSYNIYLGRSAGANNNGSGNVFVGTGSGTQIETGNYNVCIGNYASRNHTEIDDSYKLYINMQENSAAVNTPLIYGEFANSGNGNKGKVAINYDRIPLDAENNPYTLAVNGKTMTEEVQVMLEEDWWPDYVFTEDYNLMSLTDLEAEIEELGHLPGVPSAEEVEENGHALGQMDAILLEKIEELTLHLIDMNKEMEKLRERNEVLETRLSEVEDK